MILFVVSFLLGQLLSAWWSVDPRWLLAAVVPVSVASVRSGKVASRAARMAAAAALGLALAVQAVAPAATGCFLPREPTKQWIEAEIEDVSGDPAEGLRLRALVRAPGRDPTLVCGSVLLTLAVGAAEPRVGERWRLHASLRRVRSFANPRGFDAAGSLARRGVWVSGYAGRREAVRLASAPPTWAAAIGGERRRIGRLIDEALPSDHAALLRSLVIGDQSRIPPGLRRRIADAGLAHLLSVSGLHIGIVWGLLFAALNWLLSRSEWLLLHASVRALAALGGVPAALGYATLAGREVPAVRSVTMTTLLALAWCAGRETDALRVLVLAAGWIALVRPGSPLEVSFQLSFASVLALVLAGRAWSARDVSPVVAPTVGQSLRERTSLAVVVSAAALLGTAPLVALHFDRLSPIGLVTNPLLVPLAGSPATILGLAGAVLSALDEDSARTVFTFAWWPLELLRAGTEIAAALPWASVAVPKPTIFEVALGYAMLAWPWLPSAWRRPAAVSVAALLAIDAALWVYEREICADLRARVLDVGQGDGSVIELPRGRVMVIDAGGFGRSRFDVGERVVLPYLRSRKIGHVDYLVATHGDWDHQGGLEALARELPVRELWVPASAPERARLARLERTVEARGGIVRPLSAGDVPMEEDGLRVECLHPRQQASSSSNDSSLVLRIEHGATAMLFTGDVEAPGEASFTARNTARAIDLLKAPHHGSATSSGEALLDWARPRIAVISLGAGNGYGFPDRDVLERYARHGARVVRTDDDGSLWVESDGRRLAIRPRGEASAPLCSLLGMLC